MQHISLFIFLCEDMMTSSPLIYPLKLGMGPHFFKSLCSFPSYINFMNFCLVNRANIVSPLFSQFQPPENTADNSNATFP